VNNNGILVITTGGTIDKTYFDCLSEYQIIDSSAAKLLKNAKVAYPYRVEEVCRKDSLELTDAERADIFRRTTEAPESRIVITHGTDTMAETAKLLASIHTKTIVLTGAFRPARFAESDAAFNLGMAFSAVQVAPAGVYLAMNGQIFDGLNVRKDREAGQFLPAY
jgi:L-asparaginase